MKAIWNQTVIAESEDTVVVEVYDGPHYPIRPSWYTSDEDAR